MRPEIAKKKNQQRLLVIILLSVLLAVVISSPPAGIQDDTQGLSATLVSLKTPDKIDNLRSVDDMMDRFSQLRALRNFDTSDVFEIDLFRRPLVQDDLSEEITIVSAEQPEVALQVGAIYGSFQGSQKSALINGTIVSPGLEIESLGKVIDVSEQGVRVSP